MYILCIIYYILSLGANAASVSELCAVLFISIKPIHPSGGRYHISAAPPEGCMGFWHMDIFLILLFICVGLWCFQLRVSGMVNTMKEATPSPLGPKFRTRSRGNGSDQEAGIEVAFLQQHVQEPCAAHTKSQPLVHSRWSWTAILCDAMTSVTSAALHCWCLYQIQYRRLLHFIEEDFSLHSHLISSCICNTKYLHIFMQLYYIIHVCLHVTILHNTRISPYAHIS